MNKETKIQEQSVFDIANYFIELSQKNMIDEGVPEGITHLKLQKILYFSQAAFLALYDKKLFNDPIEAWKFGPVIRAVYEKYKEYGNQPLEIKDEIKGVNVELKEFLDGIWELFGKYSAAELIDISHRHTPWKEAYEKGENTEIMPEVLKDYYKGIFQFQENG